MGEVEERLRRLGGAVAEADPPDTDAIAAARARVLDAEPRRRSRRLPVAVAAAAALAVGIGGWLAWPEPEPALQLLVEGEARPPGEWLAAHEEPLALRFEDGTAIDVAPRARARVERIDTRGARVRLESGSLDVDVAHRPDASWDVSAGPYTVHVVGTAFDVRWDPEVEQLEVRMREGAVRVRGGPMSEPQVVRAGWTLSATPDRVSLDRNAPPVPVEPVAEQPAQPTEEPRAEPTTRARPPVPSAELYAEADRLRFAGRRAEARRVLLELRRRGERGRTAFLLGRLALELGEHPEARRWFERYLREEPRGALAESALGRLMEIEEGLDPSAARSAAERYLARYPRGAHAPLARRLSSPR